MRFLVRETPTAFSRRGVDGPPATLRAATGSVFGREQSSHQPPGRACAAPCRTAWSAKSSATRSNARSTARSAAGLLGPLAERAVESRRPCARARSPSLPSLAGPFVRSSPNDDPARPPPRTGHTIPPARWTVRSAVGWMSASAPQLAMVAASVGRNM